jgi:hypothetical protein
MRLRLIGAAVLACALALVVGTAAEASPRHRSARPDSQAAQACVFTNAGRVTCAGAGERATGHARVTGRHLHNEGAFDPRPAAWCGWWLRQQLGVADRLYNLARAWARWGQPAHGPAEGVIVVWRHHVGLITGRAGGQWIVKSGNDGHAVRERPRSLAGVIAYRRPNGMAGL